MDLVEKFNQSIQLFLNIDLATNKDAQIVLMAAVILGLVISLLALRIARSVKISAGYQRLVNKVEELVTSYNDLKGKYEYDRVRFNEEISSCKKKIEELEQIISAQEVSRSVEKKSPEPEIKTEPSVEKPPVEKVIIQKPQLEEAAKPLSLVPPVIEKTEVVVEKKTSGLFQGLKKTRDLFLGKLSKILSKSSLSADEYIDELEELLITSDLGVKTSQYLLNELRGWQKQNSVVETEVLKDFLHNKIFQILNSNEGIVEISSQKAGDSPRVVLVVGVNGVGKTTTIGKIASKLAQNGAKVLLGAADTFRAAAVEQIEVWAQRAGVELLCGEEGAKPATVAYQALTKAQEGSFDVVIIDTAGRLHTKVNLMKELSSVISVIKKLSPDAPHETLLVVDAATGQNALEQAKEFHDKANLTGIIVTKLDGTPKGGIVVAIKNELGIPIRYIGIGESVNDLKPFSAKEFTDALFSNDDAFVPAQNKSELRVERKRVNNDG